MTAEDYTPQQIATLAQRAVEAEHALPALLAIRKHPWTIFWSLAISMCVIMEGYDTSLVLNFYAYPAFARKFGRFNEDSNNYQLEPHWQVSLSNAGYAGSFLGTWLTGYVVDKFGHVKVLVGALLALGGFIFIVFFAPSAPVLLVGHFLCGLPWGIFASTAPAYASEVLPMSLRVYMTSWTNMCFIVGQLIAAGVLAGLVNLSNDWSYRIPLAVQWLWPAILIPIIWHAPDSPWHFVRQKRYDDAKSSLQRLRLRSSEAKILEAVGLMIYTNHIEQEVSVGTSYWDCFRGVERRRTEIACIVFAGQILSGFSFAHNSTYFFQQVGLSVHGTYQLNIGGSAMSLVAAVLCWIIVMPRVGRRRAYLWGMGGMCLILYLIGGLSAGPDSSRIGITQAVLTLIWSCMFQLSVGQLGWSIPAEIGSTRLRQKTICLGRNAYTVASIVAWVAQPYFMNPTALNLKGYTGFIWGSTALMVLIWGWCRLPETKDRTFDELDVLFAKRITARRFKASPIERPGTYSHCVEGCSAG